MKTPRQIAIADHLWEAFERMAEEMGSDRDALVNQAMHVFARLHGFVVPGAPVERGEEPPEASRPPRIPDVLERKAVAEEVLDTAERLERAIRERPPPGTSGGLVLVREDGTPLQVDKDRFLVGRGRHCDLVIDSAKISREHAAIVREPDGGWAIEDLGSANGTWYRRERIERRRIEDGDEYYVSAEKIRCVLR